MRVEKERKQSDSLPKQTHTSRAKWENDISFIDSPKENYKEFVNQYLELRQQLQRQDEPPVRIKDLQGLLLLSSAWHKTKAASVWYLQRTGEWPVGCQGHVSVPFITHKLLCSWKESHDSCSQSSPAIGPGFPPFLVSTPSSRANWQSPAVSMRKGPRKPCGMWLSWQITCRDSHSLSIYSTPTMFQVLGMQWQTEQHTHSGIFIWNNVCPGLFTSISSCREGNCHILSLCSVSSTGSHSPTSSHFPALPAMSIGSVTGMPAQQTSPGKLTAQ